MAKYVATPIGSGFNSQANLNQNFEDIEDNFQRVLYRDGSTPNQMETDFDMNSNDIINVNNINTQSLAINGQQVVANETFVTPLPDPTGQSGKFIRSDGVSASWQFITKQDVDGVAVIQVDTVADMKALTGLVDGAAVIPLSRTSPGDVRMPRFRYSSSAGTENSGTIFTQTTGGGSFHADKDGHDNVKWFAAKGDGSTIDTTAFTNAAAANTSSVVFCPKVATSYVVNSDVVNASTVFVFEGGRSNLTGTATAAQLRAIFLDETTELASGIYNGGQPIADDLRTGKIEIVCGTIRQQTKQTVTITAVGTTATVTHVNHGYTTGDFIVVSDVTETAYNGYFAITVTGTDTYTYTMTGSPASPATGTPRARKPAKWDYILDSAHTPIGMDTSAGAITASSATLTLPYLKTYSKVLAIVVGADETLANALNLTVGPSVGLSNFQLKMSVNLTLAAHVWWDGAAWQISYGAGQGGTAVHNVQIGTITIPTNGTLSIPHSFCPGIDAQVQPFTNLGAVVPYIPAIRAISDSAILVNFINPTTDALRTDASPSTRMSMHVTKNFSEGIRVDGTQGSYELDLQEGNIWFYGIMLV